MKCIYCNEEIDNSTVCEPCPSPLNDVVIENFGSPYKPHVYPVVHQELGVITGLEYKMPQKGGQS